MSINELQYGAYSQRKGHQSKCINQASLISMSNGAAFAWIAPLLVRLKRPDSELPMTEDESSWVVSIIQVGNFLVPLPAGRAVDAFGRKPVLLAAGPLLIIAWVLVLTTRSVPVLYVVRLIQGLSMGVVYTILPIYLGEIAGPRIRGSMGYFFPGIWYAGTLFDYVFGPYLSYQAFAWISMALPIGYCFPGIWYAGTLFAYVFGPYLSYQAFTWISMALPIIFLVTFVWMPESPYYLLMKGRTDEAKKCLERLRDGDVDEELDKMKKGLEEEGSSRSSWRELLGTPEGRKSLSIVVLVTASYAMAGGTAMFSYSTDTFAKTQAFTMSRGSTTVTPLSPDVLSILMGSLLLLLLTPTGVLVDRLGRRPVLIVSSLGSTLFLTLTSTYYYILFKTTIDTSQFDWLPYCTLISYTLMIGCGTEAVVPLLQAEVFSNRTRGTASAICHLCLTLMSFFCLKMYQVVRDYMGLYFLYACFSIASAIGAVYIYFCVPETKGLTFDEIQKIIKNNREKSEIPNT